ncbi:MAG: EAL domain-containing protein [Sulfurimonas sp.]|jgi:diguanylate cyclase (GGDEF)-like protein
MFKFSKLTPKLVVATVLMTLLWVIIAFITVTNRVNDLKNEKYFEISNQMKKEIKVLIEEKAEAVLIVAFSTAQNTEIKETILNNNSSLRLDEYSKQLGELTFLKNLWFQIITADGKSFYRSWTDKKGDDLKEARLDIAEMINNPKVVSSISVGKFDFTFKSMVPIYSDGKFIGIVETLAKFNSIAAKMENKGYKAIILADKKYKNQLQFAFTKIFIDDYYVANKDVKKELLSLVHEKKVESYIGIDTFYVDKKNNMLAAVYHLPDIHNQPMGHFIIFQDLEKIDISNITRVRDQLILLFFIAYIFILAFFYYLYAKQYQVLIAKLNSELEEKVEEKTKELTEQAKNLDYLAHHDSLTGLPNRILFLDRFKQALRHAKRRNSNVTVLFLDLDRFKEINDTFGHEAGDILLREVADKLVACVREEDTIARLGGDEFTIILENMTQQQTITFTKHIIEVMQEPIVINKQDIYATFSIGISIFPDDGDSAAILLRNADTAMYKAKDNGKNSYQFYNSKMTELAFERVVLESSLRKAIDENEFVTYYQPKMNSKSDKVIGLEALVRWKHPELGLVPPMQFITLAEDIGLIKYIDQWMMMNAMKTIKRFQDEGIETGILSLNVSMNQLENKKFIQRIKELIVEIGFDTKYLELEITESQIMKNPESAINTLTNIRNLGIKISVDDFGTGYSSLSYLKRLPIDNLKIDRAFIKDAYKDEDDAAIVRVIIALAKSLKLNYIAEGVETQKQLDFLHEEGCHYIQGYLYSKPLPEDEFKEFLLKHA